MICILLVLVKNSNQDLVTIPRIVGYDNYDVVTILAGGITHLVCEAKGEKVWWSIDSEVVSSSEDVIVRLLGEETMITSHLSLPVSQEDNNKVIRCSAQSLEVAVILNIIFPPITSQHKNKVYQVMEGDSVELTCEMVGNPSPHITWYRLDKKGRAVVGQGEDLIVGDLIRDDVDTVFECQGDNIVGLSEIAVHIIKILCKYIVTDIIYDPYYHHADKPSTPIVYPVGEISPVTGSPLTISCTVSSYPHPQYQWLHHHVTGDVLVAGYLPVLVIPSLSFSDSGYYVCIASNIINTTITRVESNPVTVSVVGPPHIKNSQASKEIMIAGGDDVDIRIPFCSFPPPVSSWLLPDPEEEHQKISLLPGSSYRRFLASLEWEDSEGHCYEAILHIDKVTTRDSGGYTLELENSEGGVKYDLYITVIMQGGGYKLYLFIIPFITIIILLIIKVFTTLTSKTCQRNYKATFL